MLAWRFFATAWRPRFRHMVPNTCSVRTAWIAANRGWNAGFRSGALIRTALSFTTAVTRTEWRSRCRFHRAFLTIVSLARDLRCPDGSTCSLTSERSSHREHVTPVPYIESDHSTIQSSSGPRGSRSGWTHGPDVNRGCDRCPSFLVGTCLRGGRAVSLDRKATMRMSAGADT